MMRRGITAALAVLAALNGPVLGQGGMSLPIHSFLGGREGEPERERDGERERERESG
jgi:hypothetical protein